MALIIRPGLWSARQQPQVAVEIDWTHPLARGLVMCFLACPGGGMVDLTGRARVVSGVTQPVRPSGLTFDTFSVTSASAADLNFTSGGWAIGVFTHSAAISATIGANPVAISRVNYTSESVNSGWSLGAQGNSATLSQVWQFFSFANNAAASYNLLGTSQNYVGDVFLGGTSDGTSTRRIIVNGVQEATSAANLNPLSSGTAIAPAAAGGGSFDGSYLLLAWNRDVTLPEWAWLNSEPYCFLRPRAVISFYTASVTTTPFTPGILNAPLPVRIEMIGY